MIGLHTLVLPRPVGALYGTRLSTMGLTPGQDVSIAKGQTIIWDTTFTLGNVDNQGVILADVDAVNTGATIVATVAQIRDYNGGATFLGMPGKAVKRGAGKFRLVLNGIRRKASDATPGHDLRYVADDRGADGRLATPSSVGVLTELAAGAASTGVTAGTYTITKVDATNFTVTGPGGYSANGTLGTYFDGRIKFTMTAMPATVHAVIVKQLGFVNDGVGRGIRTDSGGILYANAEVPAVTRTFLGDHIQAGSSTMVLSEPAVGWLVGDEVAVGSTDFYGYCASEKRTITAISADKKTITVSAPFTYFHWGKLQYVNETVFGTYLSLTEQNHPNKPQAGVPSVIDERAPVIHLTRAVTIEGADDTAWNVDGFGVHVMAERKDRKSVV